MAQFYASIQGNRGEATRMGTKVSGIHGHIRGWDAGVEVWIGYNKNTNQNVISISLTKGSNGGGNKNLWTGTEKDLELLLSGLGQLSVVKS